MYSGENKNWRLFFAGVMIVASMLLVAHLIFSFSSSIFIIIFALYLVGLVGLAMTSFSAIKNRQ